MQARDQGADGYGINAMLMTICIFRTGFGLDGRVDWERMVVNGYGRLDELAVLGASSMVAGGEMRKAEKRCE